MSSDARGPIGSFSPTTSSTGQEIVAYCRGAYCIFSFEAVALLRQQGFKVRRLEDGFPEWRAAGLPVTEGGAESNAQA